MVNKTYLFDETPGSLSNLYEIKVLICNVLKTTKQPLTQDQLNKIFQLNKTINYFNFCVAINELINSKHISKNDDGVLNLTKIGDQTAEELIKIVPKTTLKKTLNTLQILIQQEREDKNRKIKIKKQNDGFIVKLVLEETGSNLIDLELFCPTHEEALKFKSELKLKTTEIYKTILAIINDDFKAIIDIANKCQQIKRRANEQK